MAITRSPRAPSFDLEESLKKALVLYAENGKHLIPADLAAKQLGYTGANNGSAARCLASLKAFGLLDSNNKGDVSVAAEIEDYRHAPDAQVKQDLLLRWLRLPKIYDELLNEYHDRLPSDQVVRYKLIKKGFKPTSAEDCLKNFKASVGFVDYFATRQREPEEEESSESNEAGSPLWGKPEDATPPSQPSSNRIPATPAPTPLAGHATDRIPVRLSGGRRAWIEVPSPFHERDKDILKNQIDLIFADEEDDS